MMTGDLIFPSNLPPNQVVDGIIIGHSPTSAIGTQTWGVIYFKSYITMLICN